jgi:hypothetical protein
MDDAGLRASVPVGVRAVATGLDTLSVPSGEALSLLAVVIALVPVSSVVTGIDCSTGEAASSPV